MNRAIEFLEGKDRLLSISRVLLLGSFMVSSWVMVTLAIQEDMTEGYLTVYLGTFAGTYIGGKVADRGQSVKPDTE